MKGGGRKKKTVVNLNTLEDEDEASEDTAYAERNLQEFTRLKAHLSGCPIHSKPNEWCKINARGAHVKLTVTHLGAWAHALVRKYSFR